MIRLLLWVDWRALRNSGTAVRRLTSIMAIAFIVAIMLVSFAYGAYRLGSAAQAQIIDSLAGFGLLALFLTLFIFGIPPIFNTLFAARDVELLFTLPIPTRSIYLVKFGEILGTIGAIAFGVSLVPMIGLGLGSRAGWFYYVVLPAVILAAVLATVAICSLACLLMVQLVPTARIKEGLTALYILSGVLSFAISQAIRGLGTGHFEHLPLFPVWTPMRWGGSALSRAAHNDWLALLPLAGLFALAALLLAVSTLLVERGFRLGWIQLSEGERRRKRSRRSQTVSAAKRLPHPILVIGLKELRTLQRDIREWTQIVPSLVFFGFAGFKILDSGGFSLLRSESRGVWLLAQAALVGMVASSAMTLAAPAIAREGLGLWLVRSLPISGWTLTLGKFWVYWLLPSVLVTLAEIVAGIVLGWSASWMLVGILVALILIAGAVSIGICLGTFEARYDPDHPMRRFGRGTSLALFFIEFIYLFIAMVPAGATLLPTSLGPALAEEADRQGGFLHFALQFAHYVVSEKARHGDVVNLLGWFWLCVFGLGTAAIMLQITAERVDAGVQIEIVQGS